MDARRPFHDIYSKLILYLVVVNIHVHPCVTVYTATVPGEFYIF